MVNQREIFFFFFDKVLFFFFKFKFHFSLLFFFFLNCSFLILILFLDAKAFEEYLDASLFFRVLSPSVLEASAKKKSEKAPEVALSQ